MLATSEHFHCAAYNIMRGRTYYDYFDSMNLRKTGLKILIMVSELIGNKVDGNDSITTKIWVSNAGYEKAKASVEESLKQMQLDYI